jgi:hypothetical protein
MNINFLRRPDLLQTPGAVKIVMKPMPLLERMRSLLSGAHWTVESAPSQGLTSLHNLFLGYSSVFFPGYGRERPLLERPLD